MTPPTLPNPDLNQVEFVGGPLDGHVQQWQVWAMTDVKANDWPSGHYGAAQPWFPAPAKGPGFVCQWLPKGGA